MSVQVSPPQISLYRPSTLSLSRSLTKPFTTAHEFLFIPKPKPLLSFTQTGWQIQCLKVLPLRGFLFPLSFGSPQNDTVVQLPMHFQLVPTYQDNSSMNLTKDFPSSASWSSPGSQGSTWNCGSELRERSWCSSDGWPVCLGHQLV